MSKSRSKKKKKNKSTGQPQAKSSQAQSAAPSSDVSAEKTDIPAQGKKTDEVEPSAKEKSKEKSSQEKGAKKAASTSSKTPKKQDTKKQKKPNIFKRFATYCGEVKAEMQRVTWPTKSDVMHSSLVVIGALIFFGVLIYLVDSGMIPLLLAYSKLG